MTNKRGKDLLEKDYPKVSSSKGFTTSYIKQSISHSFKHWYAWLFTILIILLFFVFNENYAILCFGLGIFFFIGLLTNASFIVNSPSFKLYSVGVGEKALKIIFYFVSLLLIFLGFVFIFS